MNNKKFAFTLAEVLITLGIIGIVAAMTIPTLMTSTEMIRNRSMYKKAMATLNQSVRRSLDMYDMDFASTSRPCASTDTTPIESTSICAIFNGTLTGFRIFDRNNTNDTNNYYSLVPTIAGVELDMSKYTIYQISDGAVFGVPNDAYGCSLAVGTALTESVLTEKATDGDGNEVPANLARCIGFIDVNGSKLPNKEVTCSEENVETKLDPIHPCFVHADPTHMSDIYPVLFHDSIVEPATNASKSVFMDTGPRK